MRKGNNYTFNITELKKQCEQFECALMRSLKEEEFDSHEGLKNAMAEAAAALNWVEFQIRRIKV